ncbi:MAG: type IX secretion system sortase PorU, partial [Flavobacteriales bacterium]|nr:type IX secretion system sortase PorU [Flavobacteriales bacterium]
MNAHHRLVLGLLVGLVPALAGAQERSLRHLEWRAPSMERSAGSATQEASRGQAPSVAFDRAFLDASRQDLPYFHEVVPLKPGTRSFTVRLENTRYEPLSPAERDALPGLGDPGPVPEVHSHLGWMRKQPHALVDIYPYRSGPTGPERLVDFSLVLEQSPSGPGPIGRPKSYPSTSRLATGDWYRMQVATDGVYVLTQEMLGSMGADVDGLSSDAINIYGLHCGQLSYQNSGPLVTDLVPNAVLMEDGGDGSFDPGDRILFWATGPHTWKQDTGSIFRHTKHVFTDSASYFVGIGVEPPVRIQDVAISSSAATRTTASFNDHQFIERDLVNLIKSGRTWFGETFDNVTTHNYNFSIPLVRSDAQTCLTVDLASRTLGTGNASSWSISSPAINETFSVAGHPDNYAGLYARPYRNTWCTNTASGSYPVTVSFNKFDPVTSVGWMNWIEMNCRRDLLFVGDQLTFRDVQSVGVGNITEFVLQQGQNVYGVWEVTDPTRVGNVPLIVSGTDRSFRLATDSLREFVAFRNSGLKEPTFAGRVPNQDLHALQLPVEMVIVAPPLFLAEAQELADRRNSEGLVSIVVTPQQIYNEFSSGQRDATAIKRFMKMLYDRAGTDQQLMPQYLLLFGDGAYDNINYVASNQNFIPSYQTADATNVSGSYTSDDYFGLLDDGEGEYTGDLVDIGIGRFPVHTKEQARNVLNKVLSYDRLQLLTSGGQVCSANGDGGANDWRTLVTFVSDDQEGDNFEGTIHMSQSDALATRVENEHPDLNISKIYLDAYQQYSTPGGERYPDAMDDLRERVQKGALVLNYVGHGGEVGWAHERVLDNSTILGWTNFERLPLFMTATCEFSRWDDPARTSAGEYVLLNPEGGGVGLMTTTRIAYSSNNFALSGYFYDHVFAEQNELGEMMRLGDIFRQTKRDISSAQPNQANHRNFALLGDPSLHLALPTARAVVTAIVDTMGTAVDTLKALSTVRVEGIVTDVQGVQLSDFNGLVIPTVYDKRTTQNTLANDGGNPFSFGIRNNVIYRGKVSVTNGAFSFTFVVPKDIAYQFGPGRIALYAESTDLNAMGHSNDPIVGGTATNVALDEEGPTIELYMNDDRFVRGGITNEDPLIFARLFDANGINTLGNSIGHDLVAVLDENTDQAIVLNDFYEADLDTYKSGEVRYRLSDLAEGDHTLRLKAWDVFNNSAEAFTEFVVAASEELALAHVLN